MHQIIFEASITGLARLILIILIVYAVYSLFIRIIIPSMMKKYVQDFQQRFTEQNKQTHENQPKKKEGEISITYVDKEKTATHNPDDAEYVDYEEIQ
jgi:anionic cell wall polymer biosynthesis LytR-Cps2A-Psr (LCP) family protein